MAYLVQNTRPFSVTIGNTTVTDRFTSYTCSDSSAFRNGIITTTGTLTLSTPWDGDPYSDYSNVEFARGEMVRIVIQYPDGTTGIHPRGLVRVMECSYAPESETTVIEIGCELAYRKLTNNIPGLFKYVGRELKTPEKTFEGISAALAAQGRYIYATPSGTIRLTDVLRDAGSGFVSIRGTTALNVSPLLGVAPVPDRLKVRYNVEEEVSSEVEQDGDSESDPVKLTDYLDIPPLKLILDPIEPTTREDGSDLENGDSWFDADLGELFRWDEDEWITEEDWDDLYEEEEEDGEQDEFFRGTETYESESTYFIRYPGVTFVETSPETKDLEQIGSAIENSDITNGEDLVPEDTSCGAVPERPDLPKRNENDPQTETTTTVKHTCYSFYKVNKAAVFLPAKRKDVTTSVYSNEFGTLEYEETLTYGPLIEVNSNYFADKYAYCKNVYAHPCNPSGGCSYYGAVENDAFQLIEKNTTEYIYSEEGEVLETIQDRYLTELAAGVRTDWRATSLEVGDQNGGVSDEGFDNSFADSHLNLFRYQRVHVKNVKNKVGNRIDQYQDTTTYTSVVARNPGLYSSRGGGKRDIDALKGIVTTTRNRRQYNADQFQPPRLEEPVPDLVPRELDLPFNDLGELDFELPQFDLDFELPDFGFDFEDELNFDPLQLDWEAPVLEEQEEIPGLIEADSEEELEELVETYAAVYEAFIEGESKGLALSESLRKDLTTDWYPTRKLTYYDERHDRLLAMRMDASSWSMDAESAVVTTTALWMNGLTGTVNIPDNVKGNATPDMNDGAPTPPDSDGNSTDEDDFPSVTNEEPDGVTYRYKVLVKIHLGAPVTFVGGSGVSPEPDPEQDYTSGIHLAIAVEGLVGAPGSFVSGGVDGGLPVDYNGSLVVDATNIVTADLFA